jgi:D-alanyl-D-alanine carboxypeptidase
VVSSERPSHPEGGRGPGQRRRWRARGAVAAVASVLLITPVAAIAGHMHGWRHDHSSAGVPYRPHGYNDIVRVYGQPCSDRAKSAQVWWPHVNWPWDGTYQSHHPYIVRNIVTNVRGHVSAAHNEGAWYFGQYGYACRERTGGSGYSTHAFGAAVDTNTDRNPWRQCSWNGVGVDGVAYGNYVPNVFRETANGHNFRWGLDWCDPHHFQYATGW